MAGMLAEKMNRGREENDCRLRMVSFWLVHNSRKFKILLIRKMYRGADKSLIQTGRKQARKHVRDERDFNKIETRDVIKFLFLHGMVPKEIHAVLTETLACFHPGLAKDLSATL